MKKVYCEECEHCEENGVSHVGDRCNIPVLFSVGEHYYREPHHVEELDFCADKNAKNNCKDFEQNKSFWEKIFGKRD